MKILFVVDYYQPKIGYGSYYIPKELSKLGHQVTILTSNYYYPFPNYKNTAGKILGDRMLKVGSSTSEGVRVIRKKMWFEVFTRSFFGGHVQTLTSVKPDIVMVDKTAGFSQVVMSLLKPFYKYKLISIDAHLPSGFMAEGNYIAKEIFYLFFRIIFSGIVNKTVDKFIAVQEETKIIMKKYYGIKSKITHIPLGTDTNLFKFDLKDRQKIRRRYKINDNEFVVVYTGKLIIEKGVHILFEALNKLLNNKKRIKLLLVGSGASDYLKFCYSKLPKAFENNVIEVGFVEAKELPKYYSASDLAVWPLQESMSMNDAASCSLPFIANNKIGAKFRIKNNNAILYKVGDSSDLADKINSLYIDRRKSKEMGVRGRELMETQLSWKKIAQTYLK